MPALRAVPPAADRGITRWLGVEADFSQSTQDGSAFEDFIAALFK